MATDNLPEAYCVYKMTCQTTGMSYIGMTKNREQRRNDHRNNSSAKKLRMAIELYGFDVFTFEVLCECDSKGDAKARERDLIIELGTAWPGGYNIQAGPGSMAKTADAAMKARRAAAQRRLWDDPEHRSKVSRSARRFWSTPENAKILSDRMRARWADPLFREKMSGSHWSRTHSQETKEKIRQIALAREATKRAAGTQQSRAHLVQGTKASWSDAERRAARLQSVKDYWTSERGQKQKQLNAVRTAERNKEMWKDPAFVENFKSKLRGRKHTEEAKRKMSQTKRARGTARRSSRFRKEHAGADLFGH